MRRRQCRVILRVWHSRERWQDVIPGNPVQGSNRGLPRLCRLPWRRKCCNERHFVAIFKVGDYLRLY
jgi:hypothetical protein